MKTITFATSIALATALVTGAVSARSNLTSVQSPVKLVEAVSPAGEASSRGAVLFAEAAEEELLQNQDYRGSVTDMPVPVETANGQRPDIDEEDASTLLDSVVSDHRSPEAADSDEASLEGPSAYGAPLLPATAAPVPSRRPSVTANASISSRPSRAPGASVSKALRNGPRRVAARDVARPKAARQAIRLADYDEADRRSFRDRVSRAFVLGSFR